MKTTIFAIMCISCIYFGCKKNTVDPTDTTIGTYKNYSILLDGTDGGSGAHVQVAHATDLNLNGNSYTLEAWVKASSILKNSRWGQWIINKGNSEDELEYIMGVYSGGTLVFNSNFTGPLISKKSIVPGEWYHIASVVDVINNTVTLYVNGQAELIKVFTPLKNMKTASPLFIGARNYFGQNKAAENWAGEIDEIRIWNTPRTQQQINENMYSRLIGNESGLVSNWSFNDSTGVSIKDITQNNHIGTCINNVVHTLSGAPVK